MPRSLRNCRLFEAIPDELSTLLLRTAGVRAYRNGQVLMYEEDLAEHFLLLTEGRVRVWRTSTNGTAMTVHLLGPGTMPGCVSALRQIAYPATVTALTEVRALSWPSERMRPLIAEHPALASNFVHMIAERNEEMLQRLHEVSTLPVAQRVARALLRLAENEGAAQVALSRQDLAELTATTLHSVSRLVSRWERAGIVAAGRKKVRILDADRLAAEG
ncbi:Crp/Fnr family transcriptional regulator [Sphingomonas sp. PL-96]|uniref:Crp/Fnr family transcriptional regulator n=1 Tax=Sphingomonas sp. PL-96 TaxID=2887201 RepID=UPI001E3A19D1|nr:Crp/Fnr family transcriptional regulator [Sphingomonas sp. PL-96]MCC2975882.1 Crp/Fnr family transcriptional regulator [Sphingomonas sp. PL-96]